MEPWNFKKNKGRKPLRLEKEKKNRRKYCKKRLISALNILILSKKHASMLTNANFWDQEYTVQMWEALLTL